jgi:hypothetical protein
VPVEQRPAPTDEKAHRGGAARQGTMACSTEAMTGQRKTQDTKRHGTGHDGVVL